MNVSRFTLNNAGAPWIRFDTIRVANVDSLENCVRADLQAQRELPLLALQTTFALTRLMAKEPAHFRRSQYVSSWQVGNWDADAVAKMATRGLLLPYSLEWDGSPAIGFELCERLDPIRESTQLKQMRVRSLRTYLVLVQDPDFAPRCSTRCWQKVGITESVIRPVALGSSTRRTEPVAA